MSPRDPKQLPTLISAAARSAPARPGPARLAPARSAPSSGSPGDHAPGELIAFKYRLVKLLGVGGMGAVWLARNEALESDVAIKLIRRDTATELSPERLLREARAAARVDHPSIVRIFDFGETERGEPFIVMELLSGESLRHLLLRKERLTALAAVQSLLPVVSALGAAHVRGIIHRDLKPENILLTTDERGSVSPKVVDFGIAKLRREGVDRRVTLEGAALGSPAYMSPEQARGHEDIDGRADIWSLSVVLYEALTGRLPFDGASYNALLAAIIEDPPRPATEVVEVDDALWRILERGLAKDRKLRWQSMQEFGEALAGWAVAHGVENDVTGRSISLAWLDKAARRPFTDPPPPMIDEQTSPRETPPPAALDEDLPRRLSGRGASTESGMPGARCTDLPLASPPAGRLAWVLVPLAVAALALFVQSRHPGKPVILPSPAPVTTATTTTPEAAATATATSVAAAAATAAAESAAAESAAPPAERADVPAALASAAPAEPAPAASAAASPEDVTTCAAQQFAPDAFRASVPDMAWICDESDPRRGAAGLKQRVVQAGAGVGRAGATNAMREWAMLHWYEMASFAVIRARCCPSAGKLGLPLAFGSCEPLDRALDGIGAAAVGRGDMEAALARYRSAIHCAIGSGSAADYSYKTAPPGGAESALRRTIDRGR